MKKIKTLKTYIYQDNHYKSIVEVTNVEIYLLKKRVYLLVKGHGGVLEKWVLSGSGDNVEYHPCRLKAIFEIKCFWLNNTVQFKMIR